MTTVNDVIAETRRYLHGGSQDLLNVLDTAVSTTTATSINLADSVKGVGRGSVLEIGTETMYVRSANDATKTAVVLRGHDGTTAATHSMGDVVRVNPSYATNEIFRAVLDEIASLQGSGLYWFDTQEISYTQNQKVYDLTLDTTNRTPLFAYNALYEKSSNYESWSPTRVELLQNMGTSDFSSGYGLKVIGKPRHHRHHYITTGVDVRVTVAFTLGLPDSLSDTLSEAENGIGPHIVPILAPGAAWRMVLGKEARRVNPDASHGSRRAEEVQPGSIAFLGRALQGVREDMIRHALEVQLKQYPYTMEG